MAQNPPEGTANGAQRVAIPPTSFRVRQQPPPVQQYISLEEYQRELIALDPFIPHPLTPHENITLKRESTVLLARLRRLEAHAHLIQNKQTFMMEHRKARIAYEFKYWRTFRLNELPAEILSNILRYVVWSAGTPQIGIRWRLQLTWVSRHLRHAAISDSTLWNAVWFRDEPPFERSLAFVDRSGISPLDLRINDSEKRPYNDEEVRELLANLRPHLHHIRMLIILFEHWEPILSVLKWLSDYGINGDPPLSMERFEIHRTGSPYVWPGLQLTNGHPFIPKNHDQHLFALFGGKYVRSLKSFTMNGVHIDWNNTPSLKNLSTLDIRRIPLDLCPPLSRFREILTSSPGLTKLSLDGAGPGGNPNHFARLSAIELPHLLTLVLANFAAHFTTSIVSHFIAPNVRDLTIMNFKGENYGPFYEFMIGRFRKIKLLTLYTTSCPPSVLPTMIKWLDSMPKLTYLRLAGLEYDILQAFLFDPDFMTPHPALPPEVLTSMMVVRDLVLTDSTAPSVSREENPTKAPRALNPAMTVLEVQNIRPEVFAQFVGARKEIDAQVKKTYMAKSMVEQCSPSVIQYVKRVVPELLIVEIGAKTAEEDELLNGSDD